jgi:2-(1,2-epoxy-1,2-dihydrophenyl)acetyl-CoA isomerase
MSDSLVTLRLREGVAVLSLNRPERHNALVPELLSGMLTLLASEECREAPVVLLRAQGRSFSIGGDLLGFQQHRNTIREYAHDLVGLLNEVIIALYSHPAPVICAVQGQVTGGSLGLLLAADRVVMARSATITPWYAEVGFSPDGGWAAMLPRIIGRQQATDWVFTNASHDAQTCLEMGLVHELVDSQCETAALAWAKKIATMQTGSIRHVRSLYSADAEKLREGLEAERLAFVGQVQTKEALNGIDKFLRRQDHA